MHGCSHQQQSRGDPLSQNNSCPPSPPTTHTHTPQGHYDTNYDVWFNATDMYAANLTKPTYEPWFIIGRHHVPLYDVRFRGFG